MSKRFSNKRSKKHSKRNTCNPSKKRFNKQVENRARQIADELPAKKTKGSIMLDILFLTFIVSLGFAIGKEVLTIFAKTAEFTFTYENFASCVVATVFALVQKPVMDFIEQLKVKRIRKKKKAKKIPQN